MILLDSSFRSQIMYFLPHILFETWFPLGFFYFSLGLPLRFHLRFLSSFLLCFPSASLRLPSCFPYVISFVSLGFPQVPFTIPFGYPRIFLLLPPCVSLRSLYISLLLFGFVSFSFHVLFPSSRMRLAVPGRGLSGARRLRGRQPRLPGLVPAARALPLPHRHQLGAYQGQTQLHGRAVA